jgi:hypothetical protein
MAIITPSKIAFASLLVVANAALAQAQEINSYEDFKLYCSDAAYQYDVASPDCDDYKPYYQERIQEEIQPQNTNPDLNKIERRSIKRNEVSGYAGLTLGAFFPDIDGADTGFGGSVFIGGRWNKYLATDLEFTYLGGGTDIDSVDYSAWGLAINPRFIIPFTEDNNSASFYISPGLGISSAEAEVYNINIEDETRLTWQIKIGFTIPIQERYNVFLQGRYVNQFEEDTVDFFGTEIGFSVNFN